ncbi:hypothetical protein VTN49DRAFT_4297 [Thermomyces lanuginosus]|uniref:uncharacterized protein n=1 Tax=Thermomyces lanuginosus TaxID=5541 RepID=UPI00374439D4
MAWRKKTESFELRKKYFPFDDPDEDGQSPCQWGSQVVNNKRKRGNKSNRHLTSNHPRNNPNHEQDAVHHPCAGPCQRSIHCERVKRQTSETTV